MNLQLIPINSTNTLEKKRFPIVITKYLNYFSFVDSSCTKLNNLMELYLNNENNSYFRNFYYKRSIPVN